MTVSDSSFHKVRVGFAMTGSFCTFSSVIEQLKQLAAQTDWEITPIMSPNAYSTDTRFGSAEHFREQMRQICSHDILHTIAQTEPIGPKKLLDLLIVAPCTGNTLAVKAHLRNARPVLLAVSTNDALANSAQNIGSLFNSKHIFFVPMRQDNAQDKPTSIVADFSQLLPAAKAALNAKQLQPVLLG